MEETITIERMGYGSEAVGRLESGKAVFVEGGAPGDVAALEIVEDKPTFARARIARLVKPSELRVRPRCEAGAACGGCPWQHLSYDAQLEAKRANVAAALERTAKFGRERAEELVRPCLPSKRQWGYRNKLELGAAMDERGTFQLGFHREGAHDIASPGACPLAHDALAKAPKALRGALRFAQGSADLGIFRVGVRHSLHTGDLEVALWTSPGSFPRGHIAKTVKSAVKATSIMRVMADPGKARKIKGVETLDGKGCWEEQLGDARYLALFLWNEEAGGYLREVAGWPFACYPTARARMTGDEGAMVRPAFANVIVQWVAYDALSPTVQTPLLVGEGAADLFVGGRHVQGTWSRAACDARTLYWDESGREVLLEPGTTWIALFPANASLIFQ